MLDQNRQSVGVVLDRAWPDGRNVFRWDIEEVTGTQTSHGGILLADCVERYEAENFELRHAKIGQDRKRFSQLIPALAQIHSDRTRAGVGEVKDVDRYSRRINRFEYLRELVNLYIRTEHNARESVVN